MEIKKSELMELDTVTVCPYCMNEASGIGCCGESSCHFEKAYIIDDEYVLGSELTVIDDTKKTNIEISEILLLTDKNDLEETDTCISCEEELTHEDKRGYIDGLCRHCEKEHLAEERYYRENE